MWTFEHCWCAFIFTLLTDPTQEHQNVLKDLNSFAQVQPTNISTILLYSWVITYVRWLFLLPQTIRKNFCLFTIAKHDKGARIHTHLLWLGHTSWGTFLPHILKQLHLWSLLATAAPQTSPICVTIQNLSFYDIKNDLESQLQVEKRSLCLVFRLQLSYVRLPQN